MNAGVRDSSKFGQIMSWNNETEMPFWNDDPECNTIKGEEKINSLIVYFIFIHVLMHNDFRK